VNAIDIIFKRRSIRKYTETPIEQEKIITLLKAAMAAPTAVNCQPWEFIVVNDADKLEQVREKCIFARYNAPAAIVVCGNLKLAFKGREQEFWIQDCSAASENILLAATSLGLGSVWIGIYPGESRIKAIKSIFNIPAHVTPLSLVYFGYPAEAKTARTRYNEKRVYWQEYDPQRKHRVKDKPVKGHY